VNSGDTTLNYEHPPQIHLKRTKEPHAKHKAQHIKSIVEELKARDRSEHITHREVFRPCGSYDSIDVGRVE
jgi:mannose-1-phosphate guanylyltransferase